jgi:hypothetical protein
MFRRLSKLETIIEARVCPEDSAIEREASSKIEVLTTDAVRLTSYNLSVFTELMLCSL